MTNNNKLMINKNQSGTSIFDDGTNNNDQCYDRQNNRNVSATKGDSEEDYIKEGQLLAARILKDGADLPIDMKQPFLLPAWFDKAKFQRGQNYFQYNYFALFVSKLSGLLAILAIPSILRVLILTGKSSERVTAFRRYLDTLSHMLDWYEGDICNPNSKCRKSLLSVRGRHCGASRMATGAGYGPISQSDMAITQFGFMGFPVLCQEKLGIHGSDEDVEGFIHFWRVIGHLLGISDQFNLCRGNVVSTKAACQSILNEILAPSFNRPEKEFHSMARALLDGMWVMVPALQADAFIDFTRYLCNLPESEEPRSLYSRFVLRSQLFVHTVVLYYHILVMIFRPILNYNMWLSVFLTQRFPFLAFMTFGRPTLSEAAN